MCFISSKAGVFCRAKDLDVKVTESWGESKKISRERLMGPRPCPLLLTLSFLLAFMMAAKTNVPLGRAFVKKTPAYSLKVQGICYLCLTMYFNNLDLYVMVIWHLSKKVSAEQSHMTVSRAQVYNSLRWRIFKVICRPVIDFQLIAGSGPFFKGGIKFTICLRQKLNYLRKTFLKITRELRFWDDIF